MGKEQDIWHPIMVYTRSFALSSIYNSPNFVKDISKPILFADDTSIIVTSSNPTNFMHDIMTVFKYLNKWFRANGLTLNSGKKKISYNLQLKMDPKLTWM
jgi:hypothetical protein